MDYASEQDRKAHQRLAHPEVYPGLKERRRDQHKILLWRYPSFAPYSSWSIFQVNNHHWVRRIEWQRSRPFPSDNVDPYTYGCEALLAPKVANELLSALGAIAFRPFQQPELRGTDGTVCGIEVGSDWLPCSLTWWQLPAADWQPLADWFERVVTEFEAILPTSTSYGYSQ
jgi:hypothetical protein